MRIRVGNGFDIHAFGDDPRRELVLGGVHFGGERGLRGHSDADVVAHCVAEALLGAAGLGDLGSHFPDTDDRWAGADSMELLAEVVRLVGADGWTVANVDCSVVAERPKLAPHRDEMQRRLSGVVAAGVRRLLELQRPDGGWGWQSRGATHEMMTPYALYGLLQAEAAGYELGNKRAVERGLRRLAVGR